MRTGIAIAFIVLAGWLKAQYYSPEAYIIHHLTVAGGKKTLMEEGRLANTKSVYDSTAYLKWLDKPGENVTNEERLTHYLVKSITELVDEKYKNALEYAILAQRLADKNDLDYCASLALLAQATVYHQLRSFRNVTALDQSPVKNRAVNYQLQYLFANAYRQQGEYEKCVAVCGRIWPDAELSLFDRLQVAELQAAALEKNGDYSAALEFTYKADSLLGAARKTGYDAAIDHTLYYNTINPASFQSRMLIDHVAVKNNVGFLRLKNNYLQGAEAAFSAALDIARENRQLQFELQIEKNTGLTYTLLKQFEKAEEHYTKAENLSEKESNEGQRSEILCIRAKNQYLMNNLARASELCEASVEIAEARKDYMQLSQSYLVLAEINAYVGDIQKSTNYSKLAEENARRAKELIVVKDTEQQANIFKEEAAYDVFAKEKADLELIQLKLEATRRSQELEIIKKESQIRESNLIAQKLASEKAQQALLIVSRQLEAVKQNSELEDVKRERALNILENKHSQVKIRLLNKQRILDAEEKTRRAHDAAAAKAREKSLTVLLSGVLIILALIGMLLYRNIKNARVIRSSNQKLEELTQNLKASNKAIENTLLEVNAKNEIIESKNSQILESITYARRIQEASLPKLDEIEVFSKESFVLHKPKDIISGDFYIVSPFKTADGAEQAIFIVGDCTGHGVPGAMLSLLCSSLVRQSMRPDSVLMPAELLNEVNEKLRNFFRSKVDDSFKDGMDIACCLVNRKSNKLYFAGAGRPLLHLRDGEITELKGEKHHIGFSSTNFDFVNQELDLKTGDSVYLFSDGYTDQFSGKTRKRFMTRNLKDLLSGIGHEPMKRQGEILDKTFEDWRGDYVQMDDVCVLGVKI